MKLKQHSLFLLLTLALAACGPKVSLTKPGLTTDQMRADADACYADAEKAAAGMANPLIQRTEIRRITLHCLANKGYRQG